MRYILNNPYSGVDWTNASQALKYFNFHTHTRYSDGHRDPHNRIDDYEDLLVAPTSYNGLSLTDHDTGHYDEHPHTLWPWSNLAGIYDTIKDMVSPVWEETWAAASDGAWLNRSPTSFIGVEGCEVSRTMHILSHFCNFAGERSIDYDYIFSEIQDKGGLATFAHPGRYTGDNEYNLLQWYSRWFLKYACLKGLEFVNRKNMHVRDERMWDNLLMITLPNKPIWGFANDDNHSNNNNNDYGVSWNAFPLVTGVNFTEAGVKEAYENGAFFACSIRGDDVTSGGPQGGRYQTPEVAQLVVTDTTIQVIPKTGTEAPVDPTRIRWVVDGETAKTGAASGDNLEFDTSELDSGKFVRFVLIADYDEVGSGEFGIFYSQPFTLSKPRIQITNPSNMHFWKAEIFHDSGRLPQHKQGEVVDRGNGKPIEPIEIDIEEGQTSYWFRVTLENRPFGWNYISPYNGFDAKWSNEGWGEGSFGVSYGARSPGSWGTFIHALQEKVSLWSVSRPKFGILALEMAVAATSAVTGALDYWGVTMLKLLAACTAVGRPIRSSPAFIFKATCSSAIGVKKDMEIALATTTKAGAEVISAAKTMYRTFATTAEGVGTALKHIAISTPFAATAVAEPIYLWIREVFGWAYKGVLAAGSILSVDADTYSFTKDGANVYSDIEGTPPFLEPGEQTFTYNDVESTRNLKLRLLYRGRWV